MPTPMPLKDTPEILTWDNRFIAMLTDKFGPQLWLDDIEESKALIASIKSLYSKVKNSHRKQKRMTWGKYFDTHVLPVVEITLSFSKANVWDAIVALAHDFPEDDEEMTQEEALDWIAHTFGKKWGPLLRSSIANLTKAELPNYIDGSAKDKFAQKSPEDQQVFLQANKQDLSEIRGEKYFANLDLNGDDRDLRVKTADSMHNLMSCHTLWPKKIEKTLSEKESYLVPILKKRDMIEELRALEIAIAITKIVQHQKDVSDSIIAVLKHISFPGTSKAIMSLFQRPTT